MCWCLYEYFVYIGISAHKLLAITYQHSCHILFSQKWCFAKYFGMEKVLLPEICSLLVLCDRVFSYPQNIHKSILVLNRYGPELEGLLTGPGSRIFGRLPTSVVLNFVFDSNHFNIFIGSSAARIGIVGPSLKQFIVQSGLNGFPQKSLVTRS